MLPVSVDLTSSEKLNVFPNPSKDLISITLEHPGEYSMFITTLNGQLIYSALMEGPSHQIDLSSFQKGVYLLTLKSVDFVATGKIVKL